VANATPVEIDDAIVLLLGAPAASPAMRGRLQGVTRLEKLLFLLEYERHVDLALETGSFEPHNFGPFSSKVYQALDILSAGGLLEDSAALDQVPDDAWEANNLIGDTERDPYATRNFRLTERGQEYYEALKHELGDQVIRDLEDFKNRFGALPLRELIRYVYGAHPNMTTKSIIRDEVLG
jgi:hypothetical protein